MKLGLSFAALLLVLSTCTWGFPIDDLRKEAERLNNLYQLALQQQRTEAKAVEPSVHLPIRERRAVPNSNHERLRPYRDYTPPEVRRSARSAELAQNMEIATKSSSDSGSGISPDTECRINATSNTMNYEDLQEMINTMHIVFGTLSTVKYYIAADYGHLTVEESEHPLFGIFNFMSHYRNLPLPSTLWMNTSPCPVCAQRIMIDYNKEATKPTIYIGSLYTGVSLQDTVDSFKCLAKLVASNYTISVWDWRDFHNNIHHEDCRDAINTALDVPAFVDSGEALEQLLQFARQLSHLPEDIIRDWC